jgi:hypothetical protein
VSMADSLCETCRHVRVVRTPRSRFFLCELSLADPAYPKYPRQPVVRCPGYRPRGEGGEPGSGGPAGGRS